MTLLSTKVGKRPGIGVYVQASAIYGGRSNLKYWEITAYEKAHRILFTGFPNFEFDFVHITEPGGITVRFMKMSSLFDTHPHVVASKIVDVEMADAALPAISDGKPNGQIYHRLETIVDPSHSSWLFHREVTKWEESIGLFGSGCPVASIGNPKRWEEWVSKKIPLPQYQEKLRLLFGQFAGNEFSTIDGKEDDIVLSVARVSGGASGDSIHVELYDAATRKTGIRAEFTLEAFARALMSEFNVKGKIVRWNMSERKS